MILSSQRLREIAIMPMRAILADSSFSAETAAMLGQAFDLAWEKLDATSGVFSQDANRIVARELLAMRIIYLSRTIEHDRDQIVARSVAFVADRFSSRPTVRRAKMF
jgi:hypothetical protein